MQIKISARHGHLSESNQAKIAAKLEKLPRLFDRLSAVEVTVDLEHKADPSVDLRLSAEHKHDFVATERAGDLMASIDGAIHKLEQQLRKYKEKVQNHHRSPGLRQQEVSRDAEPGTE